MDYVKRRASDVSNVIDVSFDGVLLLERIFMRWKYCCYLWQREE